ncbi:MAG: gamma-glutamyltransferase [Gemmatimonadaceae bacterium]|nr:gamma-glutamyltransferase [Gemmatimonadaceae bacterium]
MHRSLAIGVVTPLLLLSACSAPSSGVSGAVAPMAGKRAEGRTGMVSASQQDAAQAGASILRQGGNAVDAAVATAFALSVVDPSQTGLGGGGAATVWMVKEQRADHLSFYGRSGERPEWAQPEPAAAGEDQAGRGAAVPGMVSGLLTLHAKYGALPLPQVMAPATRLAREGFIVSPLLSRTIASAAARVKLEPRAAALFMPDGQPLRPGERLVQPELAALLDLIAMAGADAFYRSAFAERLAYHVQSRGGLITLADMDAYRSTWMRPLCTTWRGYTVLGAPPPMGGAVVLEMLHLAEQSGLTRNASYTDQPATAASFAQLIRLAQADGQRWRGDPAVRPVPSNGMVHGSFAASRAGLLTAPLTDTVRAGDAWSAATAPAEGACAAIDPYRAPPRADAGAASSGDDAVASANASRADSSFTSHLSVVDASGNAVAMTTTVGVLFGSGVWTDGVWLNSVGRNFDAATRGTNRYSNSTMSPTMLLENGRVRLVVGAAGSQYIQPATAQVTVRMLAFGEDPAMALAVARGFRPVSRVADIQFGGVHAVLVTPDGRRIGAADPRRDGFAVAQ